MGEIELLQLKLEQETSARRKAEILLEKKTREVEQVRQPGMFFLIARLPFPIFVWKYAEDSVVLGIYLPFIPPYNGPIEWKLI